MCYTKCIMQNVCFINTEYPMNKECRGALCAPPRPLLSYMVIVIPNEVRNLKTKVVYPKWT